MEGIVRYQARYLQAIPKHIGLVPVTYSLLWAALHGYALKQKLERQLNYELDGSAAALSRPQNR